MPEAFVPWHVFSWFCVLSFRVAIRYSGGYCTGVLPLPIPNREVKPGCADGTAMQCGRVGGRLLLRVRDVFLRKKRYVPLFFCIGLSGFNGRDGVDGLWVKGNGDNVDSAVFCMFSQFDDSCGKRKLTFDIINKHWHCKSPAIHTTREASSAMGACLSYSYLRA